MIFSCQEISLKSLRPGQLCGFQSLKSLVPAPSRNEGVPFGEQRFENTLGVLLLTF